MTGFKEKCNVLHKKLKDSQNRTHIGVYSRYCQQNSPEYSITVDIDGPNGKIYSLYRGDLKTQTRSFYRHEYHIYENGHKILMTYSAKDDGVWTCIPGNLCKYQGPVDKVYEM